MDTETIFEKWQQSSKTLVGLFDQIGFDEPKRTISLCKLHDNIEVACLQAIQEVTKTKEELLLEIEKLVKTKKTCEQQVFGCSQEELLEDGQTPLLVRIMTLKQNIQNLENIKEERLELMRDRHRTLSLLCEQLGDPVPFQFPESQHQDFSLGRVKILEDQITLLEQEKNKRSSQIRQLTMQIVELAQLIGETHLQDPLLEKVFSYSDGNFGYTSTSISELDQKVKQLDQEKTNRENKLKSYGSLMTELWDCLEIPAEERYNFLTTVEEKGLHIAALNTYEEELSRMMQLKQAKLESLIFSSRTKMEELWENLSTSPIERKLFLPYFSDKFDEVSLDAHRDYVKRLENQYLLAKPILAMINRRTLLRNQQNELDVQSADPKRLLNKKSSTVLLHEEKLRNMISRELPILEKKLIANLESWPTITDGLPFLYKGENYLSLLQLEQLHEERKRQEVKELKDRQRQERLGIGSSEGFRTPQRVAPKQRQGNQPQIPNIPPTPRSLISGDQILTSMGRTPARLGGGRPTTENNFTIRRNTPRPPSDKTTSRTIGTDQESPRILKAKNSQAKQGVLEKQRETSQNTETNPKYPHDTCLDT